MGVTSTDPWPTDTVPPSSSSWWRAPEHEETT